MVLIQYFSDNYGNVLYTTTSLVTMVDHDKKIYDDYHNRIGILRIKMTEGSGIISISLAAVDIIQPPYIVG
jgi:hypothetical protein